MSTFAEFAALLCEFGVDLTDPVRRLTKAKSLADGGFEVADLRAVFEHVEVTSKPAARRGVIASLVLDPGRLQVAIVDARAFSAGAAQREQARQHGGDERLVAPHAPRPDPTDDTKRWAFNRNAAMAWARVHADRAPCETVAAEMGVSFEVLDKLLEHARAVRPEPAKPVGREDAGEDDRRRQFREQMHAARRAR